VPKNSAIPPPILMLFIIKLSRPAGIIACYDGRFRESG
jgi:hypothetical protein